MLKINKTSIKWKFLERLVTQVFQLIVQVILARLLMPEAFGIIAIILVIVSIAMVFVQTGFNTAIIQSKEVNNQQISTVFYINLAISVLFYFVVFFIAPSIESIYSFEHLTVYIRVMSLTIIFGAIYSISSAVVTKQMNFFISFICNFVAVMLSGIVGVLGALFGMGIWSLIIYQVLFNVSLSILFFALVKWKPGKPSRLKDVSALFSFGWKVFLAHFLDTIYKEVSVLVIGKKVPEDVLGFYSKGSQFPLMATKACNETVKTALLPIYSKQQGNKQQISSMISNNIRTLSFIIIPALTGLAIVARPLVLVVLTEKWADSIVFLQVFCFIYLLDPIKSIIYQAFNSIGKSGLFLALVLSNILMLIVVLVFTIFYGIMFLLYGTLVVQLISLFASLIASKVVLKYNFKSFFGDIYKSVTSTIVMFVCVFPYQFYVSNPYLVLLIQVVIGAFSYLLASICLREQTITNFIEKRFTRR